MSEEKWEELSNLKEEDGEVLFLDIRTGNRWVGSLESKPHRNGVTHFQRLSDVSEMVENWHKDYIRLYGEINHKEFFPERYLNA